MTTAGGSDVAERFATAWRLARAEPASAGDFWPCCRVFQEAGLVRGQEEDLAAASLGPYRIAVVSAETPVRDFVEVLFPAIVATLPAGETVAKAVSAVLTAVCTSFVRLLGRGVVFGRSPVDRLRWETLMYVTRRNLDGDRPGPADVLVALAAPSRPAADVRAAIEWLASRGVKGAPATPLVRVLDDGGLESLV